MTTRGIASILSTLAFACFSGLAAVSGAQEVSGPIVAARAQQLAFVWILYPPFLPCTQPACDAGGWWEPDESLVYPGTPGITAGRDLAWSPDGGRIAFEFGGDILVIDVAGGSPANLTNHPAFDSSPAWSVSPAWSPDGSQIAFGTYRDGQAELYLMNPDGSGSVRLTNRVGFTGQPAWSPDSVQIAFNCAIDADNGDLCAVNRDGTGFARLTNRVGSTGQPAWSPDGAQIAFNCAIDTDNGDICAVNRDGTGFVRLTTDPAWDCSPAWSPDGSRIAFATGRYSADAQLAVMNPDGTGVSQVGTGIPGYPSGWSPDGTRIAFVAGHPCDIWTVCPSVYVINADGTAATYVAEGYDPAWRPAFSPPGPAVVLSASSLAFGSHVVGSSSPPQVITLVNTGTADLTIASLAGSGDFAQTNTCASTVAAGASCTISVSFTPTVSGPRTGAVTIVDNAASSPHVVALSGAGNTRPVASFSPACLGRACTFDGSGSSDPDGTVASLAWNLGDGTTASGPTVRHTYAAAGTYIATLTVTDNGAATATLQKSVSIVNAPPVPSFSSACLGLTCSFDGSGASDPDGTIAGLAWNFGDGTAGSGPTVRHTYAAEGTYTATLTVTDNGGATSTQSRNITVGQAHIGDLDRASTNQGTTWTAIATITVHDSAHRPVANATVSGSWSVGGTGSCATDGSGQCAVSRTAILRKAGSATFSVVNVTHATRTYNSAANHDPDRDSTKARITVKRP
jgi:Tol biopolymer transport system component/PKD repeat protein